MSWPANDTHETIRWHVPFQRGSCQKAVLGISVISLVQTWYLICHHVFNSWNMVGSKAEVVCGRQPKHISQILHGVGVPRCTTINGRYWCHVIGPNNDSYWVTDASSFRLISKSCICGQSAAQLHLGAMFSLSRKMAVASSLWWSPSWSCTWPFDTPAKPGVGWTVGLMVWRGNRALSSSFCCPCSIFDCIKSSLSRSRGHPLMKTLLLQKCQPSFWSIAHLRSSASAWKIKTCLAAVRENSNWIKFIGVTWE